MSRVQQVQLMVLSADFERAERLAAAMTADPVTTPPGDPGWTAKDVLIAAVGRGLAAMEKQYRADA
jgi:hypothetical protein